MRRAERAEGGIEPVERLSRLVVALGTVGDPGARRRVGELAAMAAGARAAELVSASSPSAAPEIVDVPLGRAGSGNAPSAGVPSGNRPCVGDRSGWDDAEVLRFTFERAPAGDQARRLLEGIAACCSTRLAELRRRDDDVARRRGDDLLAGLATALLGTLDLAALGQVVEGRLVPGLADACRLEVDRPALIGGVDPSSAEAVPEQGGAAGARTFELRGDGRVLGRLRLSRATPWTAEQRRCADAAGALVAVAVAVAASVGDQATTMGILERSLLPEAFVSVPGLQLASRHVSATRGHEVGGDFYDAVRGHGGVTLIVGDVQGKGVGAATVTSLARHTLRAGALDDDEPGALLGRLNRALLYGQAEESVAGRNPTPRFVTAAVVRLRPGPDGFEMVVARGGHPPPIVVRWDGEVETFEPRGVLLGVAAGAEFEEVRSCLRSADTLVLYTDGVTEHRRLDHPFDVQHLGMLVRNHLRVVDADAIAQVIEDTVLFVAPAEVRDDMAVVVARVTG